MAIMDRLAKLDSSMQRGLDNSMAALFGGKVVPAEVEELLKQETQDSLIMTDRDELIAPNVFAVGVSSKDLENLSQDRSLPALFADQLTRFVRNQGWRFEGPAVVRIAEESGLRTGQLRVSSYIDQQPDVASGFDAIVAEPSNTTDRAKRTSNQEDAMSEPTAATGEPTVSLLLQDGSSRTYLVRQGSNILGRSNDADFRLPDTGVSRQHAEITWDGQVAVLVDLESTNGTTVNDEPVDNWMLADGDVITVGHSHIEVRIVEPRSERPLHDAGHNPDEVANPSTEYFRGPHTDYRPR
ncbi:DUF3662 and FHA domain-containing protein [Corynebacterium sanguinis]|uniref:DUF3662 and FHA domain-containing protein n=1 Tax=Corynebacterium sanguinis TaxID=2594913 RepID=UPI0011A384C3|nr:DUF3662 and FHA domain-containing protein [Corynebacterium sanguinis]MCT2155167.1 DUF3662 and FHA domain-containing protein [Corynebacterium sanguinis]MCT2252917.1 DUF3662 and FHA domain-containing protein [Corynebacterium sanguinis]TVS24724.1 DUF2662 domain-containing protein [Corynebacterium sanguinis]